MKWAFVLLVGGTAGWPLAAQDVTRSPHGKLALECGSCHRPESWNAIKTDNGFSHAKTGFALEGAHARVTCASCHTALDFSGASRACSSCHADLHRGELGADCLQCHTTRSFLDRTALVRAHASTRFPLDGAHLLADCQSCHRPAAQGRLAFVGRPTRCESCHMTSYTATRSPDHQTTGLPTDCMSCHSTVSWDRARFDHASGGFPLTGAHAGLTCNECHAAFQFRGAAAACVSCHQVDFNNAANPNHPSAGFPTTCATCHGTVTWQGATFNHTWFPQRHGGARTCADCHTTPGDLAQFTCATCHSPSSTQSKHREVSGFSTAPQACLQCHRNGRGGE
jgi:hypothetical protein